MMLLAWPQPGPRLASAPRADIAWRRAKMAGGTNTVGWTNCTTSTATNANSEKEHFGAYYLLLQIAHIFLQLLEKGSLLRELARVAGKRSAVALLGSLKNIADFLVESLRNWLWPEDVFGKAGKVQIRLDSS